MGGVGNREVHPALPESQTGTVRCARPRPDRMDVDPEGPEDSGMPVDTAAWTDIRSRLAAILVDIDAQIADAAPTQVILQRTDNLAARVAASDGRTTFVLPDDFIYEATRLELVKPCTVVSAKPVATGEISPASRTSGPTFRVGGVRMLVPGITLVGVRVFGTEHDGAMVQAADRTTLVQCLLDGGPDGVRRGVQANARNVTVDRCGIYNCFHSEDAQAVVGWDGTRNLTVTESVLEASGENILLGGGDPSSAENIPQDIDVNNCVLRKPLAWRGKAGVTVKNLFELKNAKRVRLSNTLLAGCWGGQGQTGYAIVLTVRNQDGGAPYSTIEDVSIEHCVVSGVASGVQILARDDSHESGRMARVSLVSNNFDGLDGALYGGAGHQVFVASGPDRLRLASNRFSGSNLNSFLYFDDTRYRCENLEVTGNEAQEGEYGIFGSDAPALGERALAMYAPGYTWRDNTVTRGLSGRWINYPAGTVVR